MGGCLSAAREAGQTPRADHRGTEREPDRHPPLAAGRPAQPARDKGCGIRQEAEVEAGRLHRRTADPIQHLPRLGTGEKATGRGDECRTGRDLPPIRTDERGHRPLLGGADRRRAGQAQLRRAPLGEETGRRRRLRTPHAVRGANSRPATGAVLAHRPGLCSRTVHPPRTGRGRMGSRPFDKLRASRHRPTTFRVRPGKSKFARRTRPGRRAHPPARHPVRRRGRLRVLPPTYSRRRI